MGKSLEFVFSDASLPSLCTVVELCFSPRLNVQSLETSAVQWRVSVQFR